MKFKSGCSNICIGNPFLAGGYLNSYRLHLPQVWFMIVIIFALKVLCN